MIWNKTVRILFLGGLIGLVIGSVHAKDVNIETASSEEDDTPVVSEKIDRPTAAGQERPWRAPNYSSQKTALGYSADTFKVPVGMEDRVNFWVDIYTKYTSDQGVLHDSVYMKLVYEVVDFTDLVQSSVMMPMQKERARRERVKQAKKGIEERLERLQKLTSAEGLVGEDLRYWNLFNQVDEPQKFITASKKGRLRFQLGQRDRFIEGIYQSGRHIQEMEEIFVREGLPMELTRLPFVESSFNLKARSKVGASGIWQFMRSTARSYMHMDQSVDERNDPLRSTLAAARKLRNNYQMLANWPLAVTGYNHGPTGVLRLVRKYNTNSIAELTDVRRGRFGFASANFYASFLAALQVEQRAEQHFGPQKWMAELRGFEQRLQKPLNITSLLEIFDGNITQAQTYNPHIRATSWKRGSVGPRTFVRVPLEKKEALLAAISGPSKPEPILMAEGSTHKMAPGETLSEIAERFRLKLNVLLEANNISDPRHVQAGQTIVIPTN